VHADKLGPPPLPTRPMAGLAILKCTHDLSDEALCDRWVEQYFCGEEFFQHALVFDRSSSHIGPELQAVRQYYRAPGLRACRHAQSGSRSTG
jgi:hypothetical protein